MPETINPATHVCARCHELQQGCCFSFNDTSQVFSLLSMEVTRISQASGMAGGAFTTRDEISPQFRELLLALNPALAATVPGNQRTRLKILPNGHCFFLTEHGCLLPVEARPYYCRIYPFWITTGGRLFVLMNANCLAQKKAPTWQHVLEKMEMDEEKLRNMFNEYLHYLNIAQATHAEA